MYAFLPESMYLMNNYLHIIAIMEHSITTILQLVLRHHFRHVLALSRPTHTIREIEKDLKEICLFGFYPSVVGGQLM